MPEAAKDNSQGSVRKTAVLFHDTLKNATKQKKKKNGGQCWKIVSPLSGIIKISLSSRLGKTCLLPILMTIVPHFHHSLGVARPGIIAVGFSDRQT